MKRDVSEWLSERCEQFNAAKKVWDLHQTGQRGVVLKAPCKSGKREIEEAYTTLRGPFSREYIHVISLNRRDCKQQYEELKNDYKIECFTTTKTFGDREAITEINHAIVRQTKLGGRVVVFFDEADYGSGEKQKLKTVFDHACKQPLVDIVLISATTYELDLAKGTKEWPRVLYEPNSSYRGAKWFLENDLVQTAVPFFIFDGSKIVLSEQGHSCMSDLFTNNLDEVAVLRVSTKRDGEVQFDDLKRLKELGLQELLKKAGFPLQRVRLVYGNNSSDRIWSPVLNEDGTENESAFWKRPGKTLVIVDQTFTRSTEAKGLHQRWKWYHDYRGDSTPISTIIQAVGRTFHYDPVGCSIKLYVDVPSIEVEAGKRSMEDAERNLANRVSSKKSYNREQIHISNPRRKADGRLDREWAEKEVEKICRKKGIIPANGKYEIGYAIKVSERTGFDAAANILSKTNSDVSNDVNDYYDLDGPCKKGTDEWKDQTRKSWDRLIKTGVYMPGDVIVLIPVESQFEVKNSAYN